MCTKSDEEQVDEFFSFMRRADKIPKPLHNDISQQSIKKSKYLESLKRRLPFRPVLSPYLDKILPKRVYGKKLLLEEHNANRRHFVAK
jgi:hypothetical protein